MEEQDSILKEFLVECSEGLGRLDQEMVLLEKEPTNSGLLASIFRTIHTLKGTCGFLGFEKLENIAHRAESILSKMRDGEMSVTPEAVTVLLGSVDIIKEILAHIESYKREPDKDYETIRQTLDDFLEDKPYSASPLQTVPSSQGDISQEPVQQTNDLQPVSSPSPIESAPDLFQQLSDSPALSQDKGLSVVESSIRVNVGLLDKLMNLIGELVLARNQLLQRVRENEDTADATTCQRLNLITTELQESVMKTRMQPIRNVWEKFPRVVRDLARTNGKEVELVMEGAETELDKTLLEAIKDPLTHLVRNAVDHGIENPENRRKKNKPEKGTLCLKAYHEGGQINVEITDDGGGIDVEKVKWKVIEKGLLSSESTSSLSEREALDLIFLPGLSTAEKVTNISGRGVGMDVVKRNIEKIGGTIDLTSRLGYGTRLKIKIPLTLAIIPALMVVSRQELFAIPQASLLELVRVDDETGEQIEVIQNSEFYRLRGRLLPLLRLEKLLNLQGESVTDQKKHASENHGTNIVVLQAGGRSFGMVVDEIRDSQEIVVKPLGRQLKGLSAFAGATIMGDGRVALILDVSGIAKEGGFLRAAADQADLRTDTETGTQDSTEAERQVLLIFSITGQDRYAIPLSLVARLEEFEPSKIERASGGEVIQYRDSLLPLIQLAQAIEVKAPPHDGTMIPVIVFSDGMRSIGLVVGQILDITDERLSIHSSTTNKGGISGSIVIQEKTTDLLDIYQVVEKMLPGWFKSGQKSEPKKKNRILLVEDSSFFRGILKPYLEMEDYQVIEAGDGEEALQRLSENQVDLVLSDIDMPRMNGIELAKRIRSIPQYQALPLIALTSLESDDYKVLGKQAGFMDYLSKFDRIAVLSAISRLLVPELKQIEEREEIHV